MTSSWLNRVTMTSRGAAKKTLTSSGDIEHPCRSPCVTGNQSDSPPSSMRTRDRIPTWNLRMTAIISGGIPARAIRNTYFRARLISYFDPTA